MNESRLNRSVPLLVGGLALLWLSMLLLGTGSIDRALLLGLYGGHRPALAEAARILTWMGSGWVVSVLTTVAAIVLILRRERWPGLVLLVGPLVGKALTQFQKYEFNRLRPDANPHLVEIHDLSFPSGHSANAMMTYVGLALFLFAEEPSRRRIALLAAGVLTFLVGLSRIVLGVHWPSDVVGGWSYGLVWVLMLYAISRRGLERGRVA